MTKQEKRIKELEERVAFLEGKIEGLQVARPYYQYPYVWYGSLDTGTTISVSNTMSENDAGAIAGAITYTGDFRARA